MKLAKRQFLMLAKNSASYLIDVVFRYFHCTAEQNSSSSNVVMIITVNRITMDLWRNTLQYERHSYFSRVSRGLTSIHTPHKVR